MSESHDLSNLPEGLGLVLSDDELHITDAQDITWVQFGHPGSGDPASWASDVVSLTCKALGVDVGYIVVDDVDEATSIERTIEYYLNRLGVEDGFIP